jgi:hypothetical protein
MAYVVILTTSNKQGKHMLFVIYRYQQGFTSKLQSAGTELELHMKRTRSFGGEAERNKAAIAQLNSGVLKPAATVECTTEDLFRVTNTISKAWVENEEVIMFDENAFLSSTSVGDVFKAGDGNFYIVEDYGFALLESDDIKGVSYPLPNTQSIY